MSEEAVLSELLCNGITSRTDVNIGILNKKLRYIQYEAVLFYDKSAIILKDLRAPDSQCSQFDSDSMKIINSIIHKKFEASKADPEVLNTLVDHKWIINDLGNYSLDKRFLIQNSQYLVSLELDYVFCKFCKQVCCRSNVHEYCNILFEGNLNR